MVDRVLPLSAVAEEEAKPGGGTLWIRLPDGGAYFQWLKKLLDMFPGKDDTIVYLADSGKKLRAQCLHHAGLMEELAAVLGEGQVVLKTR